MDKIIDLAKEIAWPISALLIAICILLIVWRVTAAAGDLSFNVKDWLKLDRKGPSVPAHVEVAPAAISFPHDAEAPATAAETLADVAEQDESKNIKNLFWIDENPDNLESSFEDFKKSESYNNDIEFWESLYVDRRRELAVGYGPDEFRSLANSNIGWVWPLIFLVRRFVRLHDLDNAENTLKEALGRANRDKKVYVLREGIDLYNSLIGFDRSLEFCRDQLLAGASDYEVSSMFLKLAGLVKKEDDPFSAAMLLEIATSYKSNDKDSLFDLAYSYGTIKSLAVIAYERYAKVGTADKNWQSSPNNMGVVMENTNSIVQKEYYEQAFSLGSGIAAANIARGLVSDGYIFRAEQVLKEVDESQCSAGDLSAIADARAKVAAARHSMEKARKSFDEYAAEQDQRYKATIFAALEFFKGSDNRSVVGRFTSADSSVRIIADLEGATCSYKLGDVTLNGRLNRKPLCFEGTVSEGAALLSYKQRRMLVVQIADTKLRVIIWPEEVKEEDPLRVLDLERVPTQSDQMQIAVDGKIPSVALTDAGAIRED
ncbi:hypothetical protein U1872_08805 [Sphingomonas sp. RB3P16]|uniref:hypothetical protein n=1 Tax=Parasphingomonas frigoris TaxID=3096163 RepID=UPI002FC75597